MARSNIYVLGTILFYFISISSNSTFRPLIQIWQIKMQSSLEDDILLLHQILVELQGKIMTDSTTANAFRLHWLTLDNFPILLQRELQQQQSSSSSSELPFPTVLLCWFPSISSIGRRPRCLNYSFQRLSSARFQGLVVLFIVLVVGAALSKGSPLLVSKYQQY